VAVKVVSGLTESEKSVNNAEIEEIERIEKIEEEGEKSYLDCIATAEGHVPTPSNYRRTPFALVTSSPIAPCSL
jgi:hypothetical protein